MAVKRGGLGRGLDSLIPNKKAASKTESSESEKKAAGKSSAEEKKKKNTGKNAKSSKKTDNKESVVKTAEKKEKRVDKPEIKPAEKPAVKTAAKPAAKPAAKTAAKPAAKPAPKAAAKPAAKPAAKTAAKPAEKPAENTAMEKADIIENTAAGSAKENREALDSVVMMKISQVEPNRNQPRKEFDKEKLEELAESIRQYGVIQPLLVQKNDGYYEIIAGERRWRASQMAGIREVPVIIRDYTEQEVVEISLIENIQREDLNPIEEANAYVRLMDEFHMTQENIAQRVSKSRAAVTNAIRLLRLPDEIREMLIYGELTEGHARALLSIPDAEAQIKAAKTIVQNGASVRETEKLVKEILNPTVRKKRERDLQSDLIFRDLEEQMKKVLGTKVSIRRKNKSAGKIEIDYYSAAELERLLDLIRSITS